MITRNTDASIYTPGTEAAAIEFVTRLGYFTRLVGQRYQIITRNNKLAGHIERHRAVWTVTIQNNVN